MKRFERMYSSETRDLQEVIKIIEDISMDDFSTGPLDDKLELILILLSFHTDIKMVTR